MLICGCNQQPTHNYNTVGKIYIVGEGYPTAQIHLPCPPEVQARFIREYGPSVAVNILIQFVLQSQSLGKEMSCVKSCLWPCPYLFSCVSQSVCLTQSICISVLPNYCSLIRSGAGAWGYAVSLLQLSAATVCRPQCIHQKIQYNF